MHMYVTRIVSKKKYGSQQKPEKVNRPKIRKQRMDTDMEEGGLG